MKRIIAAMVLLSSLTLTTSATYADHHTRPTERLHRGGGIDIISADYGSDRRACDATYALGHCVGRGSCEIYADNSLCGDPDRGTRKSLHVRYSCGGYGSESVHIREGEAIALDCGGRPGRGGFGRHRGIEILRADYGAGRNFCDAGYAFAEQCNGQPDCRVYVDNRLCGDPFRGKRKFVQIEYRCNGRVLQERASEETTAYLQCR